jgi:hypothetical protein
MKRFIIAVLIIIGVVGCIANPAHAFESRFTGSPDTPESVGATDGWGLLTLPTSILTTPNSQESDWLMLIHPSPSGPRDGLDYFQVGWIQESVDTSPHPFTEWGNNVSGTYKRVEDKSITLTPGATYFVGLSLTDAATDTWSAAFFGPHVSATFPTQTLPWAASDVTLWTSDIETSTPTGSDQPTVIGASAKDLNVENARSQVVQLDPYAG